MQAAAGARLRALGPRLRGGRSSSFSLVHAAMLSVLVFQVIWGAYMWAAGQCSWCAPYRTFLGNALVWLFVPLVYVLWEGLMWLVREDAQPH